MTHGFQLDMRSNANDIIIKYLKIKENKNVLFSFLSLYYSAIRLYP